jgi:hypothetical protein
MGTTLTGTRISDTYDSLLKATDNGIITSSAKQITDGVGNNTPLYISTTRIGIGVSPTTTFQVAGNSKIGGDLTVTGDLLVEGTTTTVDTDTLSVKDPLIIVGNDNNTSDLVDLGFYGLYDTSGSQDLYAGLYRSASDTKFHLFKDLQEEPTTTVNTSGTGYAVASLVANLEGNVTGNLTGNVTGGTISGTTGTFSGDVDIDGTLDVDDVISVEGSAFGRIEIGGASGGYIDLKAPNSDDYDFRIITSSGGNEITTATGDLIFNTAETLALTIDTSQDATFAGGVSATTGTFSGDVNVNSNLIVTTGTTISGSANGSNVIAKIDSSAGTDSGGLEIHTGDNNGDEAALLHTNYNGDEAFRISSLGHIVSTGSASFVGQVTIPETPTADTHAASKGYVDAAVEGQDTLAEILAIGNTSGGTSMIISNGDDLTVNTSTLKVDSTNSQVGINNASPSGFTSDANDLIIGDGTGNRGLTIYSSSTAYGHLFFQDAESSSSTNGGFIAYTHVGDGFEIGVGGAGLGAGSLSIGSRVYTRKDFVVNATYTNQFDTLTVDASAAKLGIRNDAPAYPLDVNGEANITSNLIVDTDTLFVDASEDNVGIGTTSPDAKLSLYHATDNVSINVNTGTGGSYPKKTGISFGATSTSLGGDSEFKGGAGIQAINTASSNNPTDLAFWTTSGGSPTERMRIDSAGNVGINDTVSGNFTTNYDTKLLVGGEITARSLTASASMISIGGDSTSAFIKVGKQDGSQTARPLRIKVGTSEAMRIDSNGTLLVGGTDSPSTSWKGTAVFGQQGTRKVIIGYLSAFSENVVGGHNSALDAWDSLSFAATDFKFRTGSGATDTSMVIDSSGNVGIGIDPSYKLEIKSSGAGNYIQHFVSSDGASLGGFYENADTDALFFLKNASGAIKVEIDSDGDSYFNGGNVGITASASLRFNGVADNTHAVGYDSVIDGSFLRGQLGMRFLTGTGGGSERMRIDSSGNTTFTGNVISLDTFYLQNSSGKRWQQLFDGNNWNLRYYNGSSWSAYALAIDTSNNATFSGNVGIGTDSPSEILQTNKNSAGNIVGGYFTNSQANTGAESVSLAFGLNRSGGDFVRQVKAITFGAEQQWTGTPSTVDSYLAFSTISNETVAERMRITSGGDLHVDGDVVAYSTTISDKRLKDNVKPLESSLDKVMNLKGVEYVWNNGSRKGQKDIGFIAQEVEDVIPEIVREKQVIFDKQEKYKTVDYEKITAVLVEAVKELTAKVERLENKCK